MTTSRGNASGKGSEPRPRAGGPGAGKTPRRATSRIRLAWFLAGRLLASRKRGRLLSFITWVALGGIVVGVTALVVVIGVMTGMQNELREKILGSYPHIMVQEMGTSLRLDDADSVAAVLGEVPGVVAASPVVLGKVGVRRTDSDYVDLLDLYGVGIRDEGPSVTPIEDSLKNGYLPAERSPGDATPLVLSDGIAARLSVFPGDTVNVITLEPDTWDIGPNGEVYPRAEDWVVSGLIRAGLHNFDMRNGYAERDDLQNLLLLEPGEASFIGVRVEDPWRAETMADELSAVLGGWPYRVESWTVTNRQLFAALKLEKLGMALILSLIVLVAAFNIMGTLAMVVVYRTKEIGILKAMGLTRLDTLRAFMFQGLWIGVVGTAAGMGLGLTLAHLIERYRLIPLPPDIYFVDRLPVALSVSDVLWIAGISLAIPLLATIHPARQAASLEPVEAIRHG